MQVGKLYPLTGEDPQKEFDEARKNDNNVAVGIDAESLFNELNALELQHSYNHTAVISRIKLDLMQLLGKVVVQQEEEGESSESAAEDGA